MPQHKWSGASNASLQASLAGYARFARDRFGGSVHFGLYSIDGQKEWVQCLEKIPREVYAERMKRFNPHRFDAGQWLDLFVDSGATAFMVTTKHHDGFCLFDSALTDFQSARTPFGRDLIAELAHAARERDVAMHFYHSLIDWHHPMSSSVAFEPASDFAGYCQFMLGQIEELCTRYGKVAGFLFDGWWPAAKASADQDEIVKQDDWPLTEIYDLIHRLQPEAMITNNHHVLPLRGEDYQVWEMDLPGENTVGFNCTEIGDKPTMAWMTAEKKSWSWQPDRNDFVTPGEVLAMRKRCGKMGASFFLNVGPMGDGAINPVEGDLLKSLADITSG